MGAKFYCDSCGTEVFKMLSENDKEVFTVKVIELNCKCTDCMIAEHREQVKNYKDLLKEMKETLHYSIVGT